jgi:hypothetical protein
LLIIFSIQIWYFYFFYYYFECPSHFTDIHLFRPSLTKIKILYLDLKMTSYVYFH